MINTTSQYRGLLNIDSFTGSAFTGAAAFTGGLAFTGGGLKRFTLPKAILLFIN